MLEYVMVTKSYLITVTHVPIHLQVCNTLLIFFQHHLLPLLTTFLHKLLVVC